MDRLESALEQAPDYAPALWQKGYVLDRKRWRKYDDPDEPGDVPHFQALTTAMAATVGAGNIVGVATAISAGGPGALFWMWVAGLIGMATKYSEAVLGVRFRETDARGEKSGAHSAAGFGNVPAQGPADTTVRRSSCLDSMPGMSIRPMTAHGRWAV